MIIFNHPSYPGQFAAFHAPGDAARRARLDSQNAGSALKTHVIKPNKAEAKTRRNSPLRHREDGKSCLGEADFHNAENVTFKQLQKEVVMSMAFWVVGAVILAALVVAGVIAWIVSRARKEIDGWKLDPERL